MPDDPRNEYAAVRARLADLVYETSLSAFERKAFTRELFELDAVIAQLAPAPSAPERQVWYMAHPVGGDVAANLARADKWLRVLRRTRPDVAVIAPWLAAIKSGEDDNDPAQRERGLLDCEATVARCDVLVLVGGRVSTGMEREIAAARAAGIGICDFTRLGADPDHVNWRYRREQCTTPPIGTPIMPAPGSIADALAEFSASTIAPIGGRVPRTEVREFVHSMAAPDEEVAPSAQADES